MDEHKQELLELAEAAGIRLLYPPNLIAAMEDIGAVVDLVTGAILIGEADTPYQWMLTSYGEAIAHLLKVGASL